jgi:hypothetical protein
LHFPVVYNFMHLFIAMAWHLPSKYPRGILSLLLYSTGHLDGTYTIQSHALTFFINLFGIKLVHLAGVLAYLF